MGTTPPSLGCLSVVSTQMHLHMYMLICQATALRALNLATPDA